MSKIARATKDDSQHARMQAARRSRGRLLHERNLLLAVLSRVFPAHLSPAATEPKAGTWNTVVCLHTPSGQCATRITDDDRALFAHLEMKESDWDRHTYHDKIARLTALVQEQPPRLKPSTCGRRSLP